jgi:iron complex transport system permease protein
MARKWEGRYPFMNKSLKNILYFLPLPVLLVSVFIGPSEAVSPHRIISWFLNHISHAVSFSVDNDNLVTAILWDVRVPRILLTFLVGGTLACSGSALQSLFRNPLVSSYILGLQSGAAFGAALALSTAFLPVQPAAFAFGLIAVGCSYYMARNHKGVSSVTLILAGVIVSGIFTALLTIVQFLTDPFKLQSIVHWTMGNLHTASWDKLESSWWLMMTGVIGLYLMRWRLNVIALGDEEARAVGINPEREKFFVLIAATLGASAAVAVAGIIGMICLMIPHMVRMMIGADNRVAMPACFTFGGSFLLIVDDLSRAITAYEIPIGIFTTLAGGPFFIYLLKKAKIGWEL